GGRAFRRSCRLEDRGEGAGESLPRVALIGEAAPSGGRDGVHFCLSAGISLRPRGLDQSLLLEPVERGGEGAGVHVQYVARDRLNSQRQVVPIRRLGGQELEDDELERSRE